MLETMPEHPAQLHGRAAPGRHRVRQGRRRLPLPGVLATDRPDVRTCSGIFRDLPVPVGVERPGGVADLPRPRPEPGHDDGAGTDARRPRPGVAAADGWRLPHHGPADHRLRHSPAVLRSWTDRWGGQGLTFMRLVPHGSAVWAISARLHLSLIHISEPTRLGLIS